MAMKIYVTTQGEKIYVGGDVKDETGQDISTATIVVGLSTDSAVPPSTSEVPGVDEELSPNERRVKILIDNTRSPGTYWAWARITDNPEVDWVRLTNSITVI